MKDLNKLVDEYEQASSKIRVDIPEDQSARIIALNKVRAEYYLKFNELVDSGMPLLMSGNCDIFMGS
jgi:hypothetical protein